MAHNLVPPAIHKYDYLRQALGDAFEERVDFIGTAVDTLIPDERKPDELLAFIAFDPTLFTDEPEDYSSENSVAPASVAYENLYRLTFNAIEDGLGEIIEQALHLLVEGLREVRALPGSARCDACGREPRQWLWDPFAEVHPPVFIPLGPTTLHTGGSRWARRAERCSRARRGWSSPMMAGSTGAEGVGATRWRRPGREPWSWWGR